MNNGALFYCTTACASVDAVVTLTDYGDRNRIIDTGSVR